MFYVYMQVNWSVEFQYSPPSAAEASSSQPHSGR